MHLKVWIPLLNVCVLSMTVCMGVEGEKEKPIDVETRHALNIVVMDPLSDRLACDCVKGYAKRKYDNLGKFLEKQLSQKVRIRYGESLSEILRVNPGRVDLIIGKSSIVEYDMNKAGITAHPIAALTDRSGSTKTTGFFTVRKNDKARKIADLEDYKIMFGPQWETEKSLNAIKALKFKGVSIPKEIVRSSTSNSSALAVIEKDADAAVISSYTLPLLEGCGMIDKGQLRVIGETGEVDFITVFAADSLSSYAQEAILKALLMLKNDKELLEQMESRNGFVATAGQEVKKTLFKLPTNRLDWREPDTANRLYIDNDKEISRLLPNAQGNLIEPLHPYVRQIVAEIEKVSLGRRYVLDQIVDDIVMRLKDQEDARLTFICSHNSRRSHMSQLWAQTAAYYYGLDNVYSFSGGTDVTACNIRTVSVLRRVGFSIVSTTEEDNPVYLIQFSNERPPMRAYSKLYNADSNPEENFIALMCCSKADKACPVVFGATSRYAIHYVDPKACDETTEEISEYNERCREIAREMFYIMSHVHENLNITPLESQPS